MGCKFETLNHPSVEGSDKIGLNELGQPLAVTPLIVYRLSSIERADDDQR